MNLNEFVLSLKNARELKKPTTPLTQNYPTLSIDEAYKIQNSLLENEISENQILIGYKAGLTSLAKQKDVNLNEPIRGYLTDKMEMGSLGQIETKNFIHPRVEPEIAVTLKSPIQGENLSLKYILNSLKGIYLAAEILDSRYENFQFKMPDVIADNTSAAGFLLGSKNLIYQYPDFLLSGIIMRKNGAIIETGTAMAVLGNPLRSLIFLASSLAKEGKKIEAGHIILTGGITPSLPFSQNDFIEIQSTRETLSFQAT